MFRFVPRFAAVLLLVVAGALAPSAAEERAFKASNKGVLDDNGTLQGRGEATHLGRTWFYVDYSPDDLLNGEFRSTGGYFYSASRDLLYFDFSAGVDFDPATGVVSGTLTFIGGTGRFQDATGSADVMLIFDYETARFFFLIDGSIDY
jgi:hypothetical protein